MGSDESVRTLQNYTNKAMGYAYKHASQTKLLLLIL